jgi:hypothetical protein
MRRYPYRPITVTTEDSARLAADAEAALADARMIAANAGITFHRPTNAYVWCDHHCSIHEATSDVYDESERRPDGGRWTPCAPFNWRKVFIESTDPEEDFG